MGTGKTKGGEEEVDHLIHHGGCKEAEDVTWEAVLAEAQVRNDRWGPYPATASQSCSGDIALTYWTPGPASPT